MRPHYSSDFKKSVVQKVLTPGGPGISKFEFFKEIGIHYTTIRKWVEIYGNEQNMKKTKEWTPEKKLEAIIKTASMTDDQLGEYLRSNGLHHSTLEQWKQDFYSS